MSSTQARSEMSRLDVIPPFSRQHVVASPCDCQGAAEPPIAEQIAKAYGLDSLGKSRQSATLGMRSFPVAKFLAHGNGARRPTPSPTRGRTRKAQPVKASYQRSQLSSQSDAIKKDIDPAFANDQYWLLLRSTSYGTARL